MQLCSDDEQVVSPKGHGAIPFYLRVLNACEQMHWTRAAIHCRQRCNHVVALACIIKRLLLACTASI